MGGDTNTENPVKPGTTVDADPGRRTFNNLSINNAANGYTITATATTPNPATGVAGSGTVRRSTWSARSTPFNDSAAVVEDAAANVINVLANDQAAGGSLTVTAVGAAAHGTTTFTATGVSYTPAADYAGPTVSRTRSATAPAAPTPPPSMSSSARQRRTSQDVRAAVRRSRAELVFDRAAATGSRSLTSTPEVRR